MQKSIFHNNKLEIKFSNKKKIFNTEPENKKKIVDINKLLNRVKLNQESEIKSKILYLGFGISLLVCMGFFVSIAT